MSITTSGREAVRRFLDNTPSFVRDNGENLTEAVAVSTVGHAKRLVKVRSGRLQSGIKAEQVGEGQWRVGAPDVPYAGFVEMGTSKMRAQPFLRPAAEIAKTEAAMHAAAAFWESIGGYR